MWHSRALGHPDIFGGGGGPPTARRKGGDVNRCLPLLALALACALPAAAEQAPPAKARLLIAFASYRDRPKQPQVYFYEHDGVGQGKIVGSIPTVTNRSDHHPSLSLDGRHCAFASELENQTSRVFFWDRQEKRLVDLPAVNASPNAQLHPTLSGDGKRLAFAAWNRPGLGPRWDILLYDVGQKKVLPTTKLNTGRHDERMPCLSGDGKLLAFVSNVKGGAGLTDIYLYDLAGDRVLPLPGMNSPHLDITPSLSGDGNLIAFASDRPGGKGGRDIYLYDRAAKRFLDLPGLNSVAHEQTPALSADGRYLAFVSERSSGQGERDVFLYDRQAGKLLPTPGLNSKRDDIDPCVVVLQGAP
jgi:Tol biopolymer transport system component